jgi:hypothetical protein
MLLLATCRQQQPADAVAVDAVDFERLQVRNCGGGSNRRRRSCLTQPGHFAGGGINKDDTDFIDAHLKHLLAKHV